MPSDFCWISTICAGVLGYVARARLSRDGADRKEDREKLNSIADSIEIIEELACEYYSLPVDSENTKLHSIQIKRLFKKIGNEAHLISVTLDDASISQMQLSFKQKVTLNPDFESSSRVSKLSDDQIFTDISDAARKLVGGLELAFRRKYRSHNNNSFMGCVFR